MTPARTVTKALQNQFCSSFRMLEMLVDVCPDDAWSGSYNGLPFWYHVYHVAFFFDYWFRTDFDVAFEQCMEFDGRIPPEFERDVGPDLLVSREAMREYLKRLDRKICAFFATMDDEKLANTALDGRADFTFADIILAQVRHAMYNIGYLNGILRSLGLEESDWYAYNEDD